MCVHQISRCLSRDPALLLLLHSPLVGLPEPTAHKPKGDSKSDACEKEKEECDKEKAKQALWDAVTGRDRGEGGEGVLGSGEKGGGMLGSGETGEVGGRGNAYAITRMFKVLRSVYGEKSTTLHAWRKVDSKHVIRFTFLWL
ncbi:hypothetical protein T492DRAFT_839353 [Pavlovales sp. CCMP2436]|nr:hypothetical protein T492DRAFT_839353 [Pavlovales sp. CCMP2436]